MDAKFRDLVTVGEAATDLLPGLCGSGARLVSIRPAGGNAGFSYLLDVSGAAHDQLFLRLAPPGVRRAGTADVFRQGTALRALDGTAVPHARVVGQGEHPVVGDYLATTVLEGRSRGEPGSLAECDANALTSMRQAAMRALAALHSVGADAVPYLGGFEGREGQVTRWDRFVEKGAYAETIGPDQQRARALLLASAAEPRRLSLTHGDYQFGNLMYTSAGELTGVIDWELCGVGSPLADLGWVMAFHDAPAWGPLRRESANYIDAASLRSDYEEAGGSTDGVEWYQALAHYKYAVIASLNLNLHRRGKRPDPEWERRGPGALTNMRHALTILNTLS